MRQDGEGSRAGLGSSRVGIDDVFLIFRRRWRVASAAAIVTVVGFLLTLRQLPTRYRAEAKVFCPDSFASGFDAAKQFGLVDAMQTANLFPLLTSADLGDRVARRLESADDGAPVRGAGIAAAVEVRRLEGTGYYCFSYTASGNESAVRTVNTLVHEAADLWRERIHTEARSGRELLARRSAKVETALEGLRRELERLRDDAGLTGPAEGDYALEERAVRDAIRERRNRLEDLESMRQKAEEELAALDGDLPRRVTRDNISIVLSQLPELQWFRELNERLVKNEIRLIGAHRTKTDEHPDVRLIRGEIENDKRLIASVFEKGEILNLYLEKAHQVVRTEKEKVILAKRVRLDSLATLLEPTREGLEAEEARWTTLLARKHRYLDLSRRIDVQNRVKSRLDEAAAELKPLEDFDSPTLFPKELAERAVLVGRSRGQVLSLMAALAVVVAIVAIAIRESADNLLHSPMDIRRRLGLSTLAVVPRKTLDWESGEPVSRRSAGLGGRRDPLGEAVRILLARGPDLRTVLIAGMERRIGKSAVTVGLARAAARLGKRVAAIDADARHPTLHRALGRANLKGLTDLLTRELGVRRRIHDLAWDRREWSALKRELPGALDAAIRSGPRSEVDREISLIPSGPLRPRYEQLIESRAMAALLGELRATHELVLIDSAALRTVNEALSLAPKVDGVILVAGAGITSGRSLATARRSIERVGGRTLGIILSGARDWEPLVAAPVTAA